MKRFVGLVRRVVPRSIRNALRRPRMTVRRLLAKIEFAFGRTVDLQIRDTWRIQCHPISGNGFKVFRTDPQQAHELDQFIANCTPGIQLLDVGAHWGFFALAALHWGGDGSRVVCIEPSQSAVRILRTNVRLNGKGAVVDVVIAAAGRTNGYLEMLTTGAGGDDFLVTPLDSRPDTVLVPQRTLSEICEGAQFRPTHIKIDVEGLEEDVIRGGQEIIESCRPIIFMELHGDIIRSANRDPRTLLPLLHQLRYRLMQNGRNLAEHDFDAASWNLRFVCVPETVDRS